MTSLDVTTGEPAPWEVSASEVPATPVRSVRVVDLGQCTVRITANLPDPGWAAYFARFAAEDTDADFTVHLVDLDASPVDIALLDRIADRTVRGKRLRDGHYRGPHFGQPAYLITRGRTRWLFGRRLEKLVWPFLVKHLLTVFGVEYGYLHLKAGAFVLPDGGATLLTGLSGSGKTVFLSHACRAGARFLTNTHALVRDGQVHEVPSAIRVREDNTFGDLVRSASLTEHVERGNFLATPEQVFGHAPVASAAVRNIVIVNYRPDEPSTFEQVTAETARLFLEQFAFGVTAYDLKTDLFDHLGRDLGAYRTAYGAQQEALTALCRGARCFVANVRMQHPAERVAVFDALNSEGMTT